MGQSEPGCHWRQTDRQTADLWKMSLFSRRGGSKKEEAKNRAEVKKMFAKADRDGDGKLSFEEFMGEETPLEKLFKSMDKEGKGTITKEEFHLVCKNLTKKQVEEAFNKFDSSGDQRLDFKEFCGMIHGNQENSD